MFERINEIEREMCKSKEIRKRTMDLRRREEDLSNAAEDRVEEDKRNEFLLGLGEEVSRGS